VRKERERIIVKTDVPSVGIDPAASGDEPGSRTVSVSTQHFNPEMKGGKKQGPEIWR